MIRRRVVVKGRVQGVFFRDSCRKEALRRDVAGWVTNRDDDTVEAVFEGPADAVQAMIAWVHQGPPRAAVADVEVHDEEPEQASGFSVV